MPEPEEDDIEFAPGAFEELQEIIRNDPAAAEAFAIMFANMRQARQSVKEGRYETFEDALEALTGERPEKVDD